MTGGSSFLATTSPNGSYQSILGVNEAYIQICIPPPTAVIYHMCNFEACEMLPPRAPCSYRQLGALKYNLHYIGILTKFTHSISLFFFMLDFPIF